MSEVLAQLEKKGSADKEFTFIAGGSASSGASNHIEFPVEFFERFSKVSISTTYGNTISWAQLVTAENQGIAYSDTQLVRWNSPSGTYDITTYKSQYKNFVGIEFDMSNGIHFVKITLS